MGDAASSGIVGIRRADGQVDAGLLCEGGASVARLTSLTEFWADAERWVGEPASGPVESVADVQIVPPVLPGARVLCIGLNYLKHIAEGSHAAAGVPPFPTVFARWTASLTVSGAPIPIPSNEEGLDWEGEVVAYVGRTMADVTPADALAGVIGYSAFNDVTAREAQKRTSQWIIGKNADRSGPLGPLVPASAVGDLRDGLAVRTFVNGESVQSGRTDEMVYEVGDTLSLISRTLTLNPGDLLATGTPSGVGYARTPKWLLQPGDVVTVEIERIGRISNPIVAHDERARLMANGLAVSAP